MKIKLICFIVLTFMVLSCQSDDVHISEIENITIENGRVVFKDKESARLTLDELTNKLEDYYTVWETNKNFVSLRSIIRANPSAQDTILFYFPNQFLTILNADHEYQVGDSVAWFSDKYAFVVHKDDESLLNSIKYNPESDEFAQYRHEIFNFNTRHSKNGREIPSSFSVTTRFKVTAEHDFRFIRSLYSFYGPNLGQSGGYQLQMLSAMQYRDNGNGNWYLASELYLENKIADIYLTFDPGYTCQLNGIGATWATNSNVEVKLTACRWGSPGFFKGVAEADFTHRVSSTYSPTGTISFINETVKWY